MPTRLRPEAPFSGAMAAAVSVSGARKGGRATPGRGTARQEGGGGQGEGVLPRSRRLCCTPIHAAHAPPGGLRTRSVTAASSMGAGGSTPGGGADAAAASLQAGLEAAVDRTLMAHVVPLQKKALLCSAACCDAARKPSDIQACSAACDAPVQAAQAVVGAHVQDFQARLGRAAQACADQARAGLPAAPSDKDAAGARSKMDACVAAAAAEFERELPRLADRLAADVRAKTREA